MALIWIEGFENYGTTVDGPPAPVGVLERKYAYVGSPTSFDIVTGRVSGYGIKYMINTNQLDTPGLTTDDTLICGIAVKFSNSNSGEILALYDGATKGVNLSKVQASDELVIKRGSTTLATSIGADLKINMWHYIEMKVKCNGSTGTYEVRIGGNPVPILSATGVNTKAGSNDYHDRVKLLPSTANNLSFDDLYICNSTGSVNNDFLGSQCVVAIRPNADDTANWTRSGGSTNYENVDEAVTDDDTTYVQDGTTDTTDLYDYASMPSMGQIQGIQVCTTVRETAGGSHSLKLPIKSGATQSDGSGQVIGVSDWIMKTRIQETDPNTSSLWTESAINAVKVGLKVG